MTDTLKSDGTVAGLSEASLVLAQGGDPDRPPVEEVATDGDLGATDGQEVEDAGTAEAVQDADAGDGDGGGTDATSWYGADDLELATSYGWDAGTLDEFGSAEEFHRAARLVDLAHKPVAPEAKEETPAEEKPAEEVVDLDPEWYAQNGYEEDTVKIVKAARKANEELAAVKQELAELRQWRSQEAAKIESERWESTVSEFHRQVDAMGDELFGNAEKDEKVRLGAQDSEAAQNRLRLFEAIAKYGPALGDAPMSVKVRRAMNIEFGDQLRERDKREMVGRIADQSRKRRPVASSNRQRQVVPNKTKPPENPGDVSYILDDPEFQGFWKKVNEGGG